MTIKLRHGSYDYSMCGDPCGNKGTFYVLNQEEDEFDDMGEALALKWSDINFDKKTLSVTKNLITVKNRERSGPKYKL